MDSFSRNKKEVAKILNLTKHSHQQVSNRQRRCEQVSNVSQITIRINSNTNQDISGNSYQYENGQEKCHSQLNKHGMIETGVIIHGHQGVISMDILHKIHK